MKILKKQVIILVILVMFLAMFPSNMIQVLAVEGDPLDQWSFRNPSVTGNQLRGLTYGSNGFVAVGTVGTILTSADGATWTNRDSGLSNTLYGAGYGDNKYVVVGNSGTLLTSADGVTWTSRTSGTSDTLLGITYSGSMFVAVGNSGTIITSEDGETWTTRTSGTSNQLGTVSYGNNTFVASGDGGILLTSPDGVIWTTRASGTAENLNGTNFANNIFVAVGGAGTILTSPDGVTWTSRTSGIANSFSSVSYGNNTFVAIATSGKMVSSPDGVTWTVQTSGTTNGLHDTSFGNNTFVVVGIGGTILTSPDGTTWTTRTTGATLQMLNDISYGNTSFVGVGASGTILSSSDGVTWTSRTSGTSNDLNGTSFGNNTYVAVGKSGTILSSPDGVTWTSRTSNTANALNGVSYSNNKFVAVGNSGTILSSPDGVTWTSRTSSTPNTLNGISYGNNLFVAVGNSGTILSSPDGVTWTNRTSNTANTLNGISYGNNLFAAVGDSGTVLSSPDGETWTSRTSGTSNILYGISYGNNTYVAVGDVGKILFSTDGETWTSRTSGTANPLNGISYGNSTFVAVGDYGAILTTANFTDVNSDGYEDNDFDKVQAFLNQLSADGVKTNGLQLNADYVSADPTTWTGVAWDSSNPKRIFTIGLDNVWDGKSLAGSLDVSGLTSLIHLNCKNNQITSLNASGLTALEMFYCNDNQITSLDVSDSTALLLLDCNNNQLSSLNVCGLTLLQSLDCNNNQLESLDVSDLTALVVLVCNNNQLTSLNVSGATSIQMINCDVNQLTNLDVRSVTSWYILSCLSNKLANIQVIINGKNINIDAGGNGYINAAYNYETDSDKLVLTAVPKDTYSFTNWTSGGTEVSTSTPNTITVSSVTSPYNITANFAIDTYTLTYVAGANGSITGTASQTVNHGANGTEVTATPAEGYHFTSWSDGLTTATRTDSNVTGNLSVTASFAINTYTLTYSAGANGSITGVVSQTVNHGANGTAVTATPAEGYHFTSWSDGVTTASRTDSNVTGNLSVTASFAINTYTITYTAGENGSITGTASQTVNHGASGTEVTAKPTEGYHFTSWSDDVATATRTDSNVTANKSLTANFAIDNYSVTYVGNGNTSGDAPNVSNYVGISATISDKGTLERTGYAFLKWNTAADGSGTDYNVGATYGAGTDITLYAQWIIIYTVTFDSKEGSFVSSVIANTGAKISVPAAPTMDGYIFGGWYKETECENVWVFNTDTVTADTTLYAKWVSDEKPIIMINPNTDLVPSKTKTVTISAEKTGQTVTTRYRILDKDSNVIQGYQDVINGGTVTLNGNEEVYIEVEATDEVMVVATQKSGVYKTDNIAPALDYVLGVDTVMGRIYINEGGVLPQGSRSVKIDFSDEEAYTFVNKPAGMAFDSSDNVFVVMENGTYTFTARDVAGNETTKTIEISGIDNTPPIVSINYSTLLVTKSNVTATVTANEEIKIVNNYNKTTKVFSENGSFKFIVSDIAGNQVEVVATVNNIDKKSPNINFAYSETAVTKNDVVLTLTADEDFTVVNNGGNKTYTFAFNHPAYFIVQDSVGNQKTVFATVSNIDKVAPNILFKSDLPIVVPTGSVNFDFVSQAYGDGSDVESITVDKSGINFNVPGKYTAVYTITDLVGNERSREKKVDVISASEPIVTRLNGVDPEEASLIIGDSIKIDLYNVFESARIYYLPIKTTMTNLKGTGELLIGKEIDVKTSGWYSIMIEDKDANRKFYQVYVVKLPVEK